MTEGGGSDHCDPGLLFAALLSLFLLTIAAVVEIATLDDSRRALEFVVLELPSADTEGKELVDLFERAALRLCASRKLSCWSAQALDMNSGCTRRKRTGKEEDEEEQGEERRGHPDPCDTNTELVQVARGGEHCLRLSQ